MYRLIYPLTSGLRQKAALCGVADSCPSTNFVYASVWCSWFVSLNKLCLREWKCFETNTFYRSQKKPKRFKLNNLKKIWFDKMSSVIVQVGQCGNQIGEQFWKLVKKDQQSLERWDHILSYFMELFLTILFKVRHTAGSLSLQTKLSTDNL